MLWSWVWFLSNQMPMSINQTTEIIIVAKTLWTNSQQGEYDFCLLAENKQEDWAGMISKFHKIFTCVLHEERVELILSNAKNHYTMSEG